MCADKQSKAKQSAGQSDLQVDASWVYVRLRLASQAFRARVDLGWLALTSVGRIKFARKSLQVFHRLALPSLSQRKLSDVHSLLYIATY